MKKIYDVVVVLVPSDGNEEIVFPDGATHIQLTRCIFADEERIDVELPDAAMKLFGIVCSAFPLKGDS